MGLADRDYMRDKHPPACTCVDCEKNRLNHFNELKHPTNSSSFYPSVFKPTQSETTKENNPKPYRRSNSIRYLVLSEVDPIVRTVMGLN